VRGKGHGGSVFPSVLSLLDQLGCLISNTATKASVQWSVFVGVVTSEEIAGVDEELGDDVLEVVVVVVVVATAPVSAPVLAGGVTVAGVAEAGLTVGAVYTIYRVGEESAKDAAKNTPYLGSFFVLADPESTWWQKATSGLAIIGMGFGTRAFFKPTSVFSQADTGAQFVGGEAKASQKIASIGKKQLGELLGEGGNKQVFAYGEDYAIALLKPGKSATALDKEIALLNKLDDLGLPTVNARPIVVDGQPAILFDRFAQGSKDVVKLVRKGRNRKVEIVGSSHLLNARSISDLKLIRQKLIENNIRIHDLQFLIGRDGRIVIADPIDVIPDAPSKANLRMISLLIQAAGG